MVKCPYCKKESKLVYKCTECGADLFKTQKFASPYVKDLPWVMLAFFLIIFAYNQEIFIVKAFFILIAAILLLSVFRDIFNLFRNR